MNELVQFIELMPTLFALFLPGYIFLCILNWLLPKDKTENAKIFWSVLVSYIIKVFYSVCHTYFYSNVIFNEYVKIGVYLLTASVLPFLIVFVLERKWFKQLIAKKCGKAIFNNEWKNVLDNEFPILLRISTSNQNNYYLGQYIYIGEHGNDSWITIRDYQVRSKTDDSLVYNAEDKYAVLNLCLKDVETIEIIYDKNASIWKHIAGKSRSV